MNAVEKLTALEAKVKEIDLFEEDLTGGNAVIMLTMIDEKFNGHMSGDVDILGRMLYGAALRAPAFAGIVHAVAKKLREEN